MPINETKFQTMLVLNLIYKKTIVGKNQSIKDKLNSITGSARYKIFTR